MTVHYIIPEGYEGHLVVRYDCPGGAPLDVRNHVLHLRLHADGTACINDSYLPTHGDIFAWSTTGRPLPVTTSPWEQQDRGLFLQGVGTRTRHENTYVFEYLWVGDMEQLAELYRSGQYGAQQAAFLEERFGFKLMDE